MLIRKYVQNGEVKSVIMPCNVIDIFCYNLQMSFSGTKTAVTKKVFFFENIINFIRLEPFFEPNRLRYSIGKFYRRHLLTVCMYIISIVC